MIDVDDLKVKTIWDSNGEANLQLAQGGTIPTLVLSDENGVKRAGIQGNSSGAGFSAGLSGYPIMWLYNNYFGSPGVNFSNATNVYCGGVRLLKEGEAGGTVTAVFG